VYNTSFKIPPKCIRFGGLPFWLVGALVLPARLKVSARVRAVQRKARVARSPGFFKVTPALVASIPLPLSRRVPRPNRVTSEKAAGRQPGGFGVKQKNNLPERKQVIVKICTQYCNIIQMLYQLKSSIVVVGFMDITLVYIQS
jgi:hypothetical protein